MYYYSFQSCLLAWDHAANAIMNVSFNHFVRFEEHAALVDLLLFKLFYVVSMCRN